MQAKNLKIDDQLISLITFYLEDGKDQMMNQLKELYGEFPDAFKVVVQSEVLSKYKNFLTASIEEDFPAHFISMYKFHDSFGKIDYDGACLAVAAIAMSKTDPSTFQPIVLDDGNELEELLLHINNNFEYYQGKTLRFMITGGHCVSGAIKADRPISKMVIFDSLGGDDNDKEHYIKIVSNSFTNNMQVYMPELQKQKTPKGCSVFALTDVRDSYKLNDDELFSNQYPLRMLRTTQYTPSINIIKQDVHYEDQLQKTLNKKGQTFEDSLIISPLGDPAKGKTTNKRLDKKLRGISDKVFQLLKSMPTHNIEAAKNQFTLQHFIAVHAERKQALDESALPINLPTDNVARVVKDFHTISGSKPNLRRHTGTARTLVFSNDGQLDVQPSKSDHDLREEKVELNSSAKPHDVSVANTSLKN